ncbi:MAG TPA: O-antigen ligase family protein [Pirellulales bacterium]|nr:O-antigen ligase family protein [Pirellulales bacterium]
MSFFLFLAVTAALFARPGEIVPELEGLPIYEWLILACLAASAFSASEQLSPQTLAAQPLNLAVLGTLAAIFLSHASHGDLWSARYGALDFLKVVIYYVLLVANVDTPARLRLFLLTLLGCIGGAAVLAVLQFHGMIDIASLSAVHETLVDQAAGEELVISRICSTGIYHDPNDLAMILVVGMMLAAYRFFDPGAAISKPFLLGAAALFFYALLLTKSRGGLLALLAALGALFQARFGWKKALLLGVPILPVVAILVGGRQAGMGSALEEGTGQSRIQLWSAGLSMFKQSPLFGFGYNRYAEEAGQVAHNSYLHAFAELGFFGGAMFLGAFFYALASLYRLGQGERRFDDPELSRLRVYLLAALAGYSASMLSLSRTEVVPTYLMLGLAAAYLRVARTTPALDDLALSGKLIKQTALVSVAFVAATYVFVRTFARWG